MLAGEEAELPAGGAAQRWWNWDMVKSTEESPSQQISQGLACDKYQEASQNGRAEIVAFVRRSTQWEIWSLPRFFPLFVRPPHPPPFA